MRNGVEVIYFPKDTYKKFIYSSALEAALPEILTGADIFHLSAIWQPFGIPLQKAAHQLEIPVLNSLRGALSPYSWQRSWWKKIPYYFYKERYWLQQAAGLHVTSFQEEKELEGLRLKAPCFQLPNPIDLEHLNFDSSLGLHWRDNNRIDPDIPLLLICGRQHHKKGLDLLIPALQQLNQYDWKLLMVGSDDDGTGKKFINFLKDQGLQDRLIQLESIPAPDLNAVYNAADLLLLPSRHENFGNVVIEALGCGCAVAVSDKTGVGGDLLNGAPANFGAVLPRQAGAWADWLANWLKNPQRAGKNCAQWAAQRYSSETVAKQAVAIYHQILESRQR
ncbi:putative alpha-glycosyltransferase/ family 4 [Synechococcus sp. Minos11]|nr:putative alpha-glycosyltransferase/ family 4 [Synechococcus sp. Minos11]